jgi:hypothetical protein
MRKTIPLPSQEKLLSLFCYKDGGLYWKINKRKVVNGSKAGFYCTVSGYVYIGIDKELYREHRLIWKMFKGEDPATLDHINRKRNDNRIENLRVVSDSENSYNSAKRKDNTSGVKGVSWNKLKNKWRVYINVSKKRLELGHYDDFEYACLVADEARDKYHRIEA